MLLRRSQAYPDLWERKKFTGLLDIRAPEDRPVIEQEKARDMPIWSPAINKALGAIMRAMQSGVLDEMKWAAKDVVEANSAHFRASGVPVFAHDPVPSQLIKIALPIEQLMPGGHTDQAVGRFLEIFDDSVKPMLKEQVMRHLERGAADGHAPDEAPGLVERNPELVRKLWNDGGEAGDVIDAARRSTLLYQPDARDGVRAKALEYVSERDGDLRDRRTLELRNGEGLPAPSIQAAAYGANPPSGKQETRIVKPYRRYQTPGMTPEQMAKEDNDADILARDADVVIRELFGAIRADRSFTGDRDLLVREFLRSLQRYFAEGGDRAVAGVGTSNENASINNARHLAAYDPYSDRIVFSKAFQKLTREEKIITIIHELLHATGMVKNVQARSGYSRDREGGMIFAQHEAILDNIAVRYAKRLGLIPQDYPESNWRRYYRP